VAPAVEAGIARANLPDDQAGELRASLRTALLHALREVRGGEADVATLAHRRAAERDEAEAGDWADLLDTLVRAACGLEGRDQVRVEVVSPAVDPAVTEPSSEQLAGAFFFHFGGFFDVKFRQSDFALGYRNMGYWMTHDLGGYLPGVDLSAALGEVDERYTELGWDGVRWGGSQLSSLTFAEKVGLWRLALHVAHVIAHDAASGGI
jgi:hypothetical protein